MDIMCRMSNNSLLNGRDAFFIFVPENIVHVLTSFTVITSCGENRKYYLGHLQNILVITANSTDFYFVSKFWL